MKKIIQQLPTYGLIILALLCVNNTYGQTEETVAIPLSHPNEDGKLYVHIINGSITVEAHNGNNVVVRATSRATKHRRNSNSSKNGLKRVEDNSLGFTVEERNNTVYIKYLSGGNSTLDFLVKVPAHFSMDLQTINHGKIVVSGVEGSHEVSNTNGPITMNNIRGSVIADALNKDIKITFDKVNPKAPMMFSSLNGDVDISFPSNVKANITVKSEFGDVFTDFEITKSKNQELVKTTKNNNVYRVKREKGFSGSINGGGVTFNFKTLNGDILIRKNK